MITEQQMAKAEQVLKGSFKIQAHEEAQAAAGEGARFADVPSALVFMFAGKAIVTLRSTRTGARYTYKIKRAPAKPDQPNAPVVYFVSLLAGPDNGSDYVYIGIIGDRGFRTTAKSAMKSDSAPVRAFEWALAKMRESAAIPEGLEIWHEGRCGRCGRLLTVPESIAQGLGPECAGRMGDAA